MATDTLTSPTIYGSATRPNVYKNFIDGEWVESSAGETFEDRNPADTRDVVGIFQKSGKDDVNAAVEAAERAFTKWRLVPAPRRAEIVYRAAEMLLERKEEYARDMTREMGKILKETRGDVQEAIDTCLIRRSSPASSPRSRWRATSRISPRICGSVAIRRPRCRPPASPAGGSTWRRTPRSPPSTWCELWWTPVCLRA